MTIQELIDKKLLDEQNKERKTSGKWTPSRFGRCYRFQVWKRQGEPETNPPDTRTLRVFAAGKLFHRFAQDIILEENKDAAIEVKIEHDDIIGYADIVNIDTVWDLKSQHSRAFWHMQKSVDIRKDKYQNWLQVMSYVWLLEKKQGRLVFISKDDLCILEYAEFLTDFWITEIEKELKILREYWNKKELPPALPRAYGGKECEYCGYKNKCLQEKVFLSQKLIMSYCGEESENGTNGSI